MWSFDRFREARVSLGLSQHEAAARSGLRQRQISDLERGAMDPRLSTVSRVASALGLELMLVPRELAGTVEAMIDGHTDAGLGSRPMYALDPPADDEREALPGEKTDWRA